MILSKVKMRLISRQSCGAVIRRSHVRMPGVRVTQGKNGGKNVLIEYLCYILYSLTQKREWKKGKGTFGIEFCPVVYNTIV